MSWTKTLQGDVYKTASEAKVTSFTQSEGTSVDECEGHTRVIFFPNTKAEKNLNMC